MDNQLLMRAMVEQREREVRDMPPHLAVGHRFAVRSTVASALARLALSIDRDTALNASAHGSVDFRPPLSS